MKLIVTKDKDIIKNTTCSYKNLEELLLKEFPQGFNKGTQLFIKFEELEEVKLDKLLDDDLLAKEFNDEVVVIVTENPEGGNGLLQTVIGVALAVFAPTSMVWLSNLGVGLALGGISQMLMDKPEIPQEVTVKDTPKAEEVFTTQFSQVKPKLGEMIPVGYGTFKKSPDLLSEYVYYYNNNEYHCLTTCLGYGDYNIKNMYLGDTPIQNFIGNKNHYLETYSTLFNNGKFEIPDTSNVNIPISDEYNAEYFLVWDTNLQGVIDEYLYIDVYIEGDSEGDITIETSLFDDDNNVITAFSNDVSITYNDGNNTYTGSFVVNVEDYLPYNGGKISVDFKQTNGDTINNLYVYNLNIDLSYVASAIQYGIFKDNEDLQCIDFDYPYAKYETFNVTAPEKYRYFIPHSSNELDKVEILDEPMSYFTIAENKKITGCNINLITNGIYNTNDDGSLSDYTVDLTLEIQRKSDGAIISKDFSIHTSDLVDATKNTPILATLKIYDGTLFIYSANRNEVVDYYADIFTGEKDTYYMRVLRRTPLANSQRISDKVYLNGVYAWENMYRDDTENAGSGLFSYLVKDMTFINFRILTTDTISNSSVKNITVEAERTVKQVPNTLDKVIEDIFTNEVYGGRFSKDFLNLPEVEEKFNWCFTQNQTILEAIRKVAISGMYMLTSDNGISLSKIETKPRQLVIPAERYKDLILEATTKNEFSKDGYRVFYRDENFEEQYVTYPETASYPNELRLYGCSDVEIATKYAKYLYLAEVKRNEKYSFTLDELGETLEQFMRVGLAIQHTRVGYGDTVSYITSNIITTTNNITFDGLPFSDFKEYINGTVGIVFYDDTLTPSETLYVKKLTYNTIELYDTLPSWVGVNTPFHLGFIDKFIKDIIIEEIIPNGDGTVKVSGRVYNEEVYT